jgi:hypothetical protein
MHDITLSFTQHTECGDCNAAVLHNIIKQVQPDVIFEELSNENFSRAYELETLHNLKSTAIKHNLNPSLHLDCGHTFSATEVESPINKTLELKRSLQIF